MPPLSPVGSTRSACNGSDQLPTSAHIGASTSASSPQLESDEPSVAEHGHSVAKGAAIASAAYGCCRLFVPSDRAEDILDIAHSLGTSCAAMYGVASMEPHTLHIRSLPPHLASGAGPIVRMFTYSMGYFAADFSLIVIDVLFRGTYPHLWRGRLAHHLIQFVACSSCALGKGQRADVMLANRSVLCTAYLAELSSVFLRLSNLARGAPIQWRRVINWMLVATFFGSRVVNFPFAAAMYWKCNTIAPPMMYRTYIAVTSCGYVLSLAWFVKIVKIAFKTGSNSGGMPSIEC